MRLRILVENKGLIDYDYVNAIVYKSFGLHKQRCGGWTVTHIRTGGAILERVKSQKFCMDLVDEIEKVINFSILEIQEMPLKGQICKEGVMMVGSRKVSEYKIKRIIEILRKYQ